MEIVAATLLGIIQGLTEFLPISSSAHLILVPWLFGWQPEGLIFDVSLHLGTAFAVLAYFWKDWILLAREAILGLAEGKPFGNIHRRLAWYLVIGTIPAMLIGLRFEKYVEANLRSPLIPAVTLVLFAGYLLAAERTGNQRRNLDQFTLPDSIWIGLSQTLALIPGVSRSGITIGTALFRNVDRASSARFSFLLSTPIIVGAAMLHGWHLFEALHDPLRFAAEHALAAPLEVRWEVLGAGVVSAALTGFFCIKYFLRYLQTRSFLPFVLYRLGLAALVLFFYFRHGLR